MLFAASPTLDLYYAHINVLEVLAISNAFIKWGYTWQHSSICIHIDNTVARAGVNNTVTKGPANLLLQQIFVQAAAFNIYLQST
jgi:hypothetical protein